MNANVPSIHLEFLLESHLDFQFERKKRVGENLPSVNIFCPFLQPSSRLFFLWLFSEALSLWPFLRPVLFP